MTITQIQLVRLLSTLAISVPDDIDCDGCFAMIAELADKERAAAPLSESLQLVRNHLKQCSCCRYEYETLLEALQSGDE